MEHVLTVSVFYPNCTALPLNTITFSPHSIMPPYNQRSQVISSGMTLQTSKYPTVPRTLYGHLLRQDDYLRLTQSISDVFNITTMPNNVINHSAHAEGSRVDHLPVEPLIMVPRLTVNPYIDYTDPVVAEKRNGLGYSMEFEGCIRVGEYIHLRWYEDSKCYLCRVVY